MRTLCPFDWQGAVRPLRARKQAPTLPVCGVWGPPVIGAQSVVWTGGLRDQDQWVGRAVVGADGSVLRQLRSTSRKPHCHVAGTGQPGTTRQPVETVGAWMLYVVVPLPSGPQKLPGSVGLREEPMLIQPVCVTVI